MWTEPWQCQSHTKKTHKSIAATKYNTMSSTFSPKVSENPMSMFMNRNMMLCYVLQSATMQFLVTTFSCANSFHVSLSLFPIPYCCPVSFLNTPLFHPPFASILQRTIGSVWSQHACSLHQQRHNYVGGLSSVALPNNHTTARTSQHY